ncbi:MAG: gamma-glutamyltransferase [Gaiellaceae bacterium]
MIPGIAAGHPATAEAGAEILAEGGTAADAAVAAGLASCVAETVMTGLLGGGHAIYWDAAAGQARNLDCFCAVPSGSGAELIGLDVPFGEELVHYAVGAASCAVPGVPAGLRALWEAYGRLPWRRLVEPALRLAREGVAMPPAHASCLAMLAPVMTMREGAHMYAPGGTVSSQRSSRSPTRARPAPTRGRSAARCSRSPQSAAASPASRRRSMRCHGCSGAHRQIGLSRSSQRSMQHRRPRRTRRTSSPSTRTGTRAS